MKKKLFLILAILFILPLVSPIDLTIEQKVINEAIIKGVKTPAVFELEVKNNGNSDYFKFYNLLGFEMNPIESVYIKKGDTKKINLEVYNREDLNIDGYYQLEYKVRAQSDLSESERNLVLKVLDLGDAVEVGATDLDPDLNKVTLFIQNKENFHFKKLNSEFSSPFFKLNEEFELKPKQKKEFSLTLDKEDFNKLVAGFYTLTAKLSYEDITGQSEGKIRFVEKAKITSSEDSSGFIINTKSISKKNDGNIISTTEIIVNKNIVSRLFTTLNPEPDTVDREGTRVTYTWARELKPNEEINVVVKTNWTIPLIIIILIVVIVISVKKLSSTDLVLKKKVSFIKTNTGEFALKVTIGVNARKYMEEVQISDRVPKMMKLYNRFTGEQPSRVNENAGTISWRFSQLEAGEIRVLSYIVHSKLGVLGKFALPRASAMYEMEGKIKETNSNTTFFIAEPRDKRDYIND